MEGVKFLRRPRLKSPYLIAAWPGMGEVAFKAASHLVEKLSAEEFAQITAEDVFYLTGSSVQGGVLSLPQLPESKFYFWKNKAGKNDLIIFLSNAQPDLMKAESYSRKIIEVAKSFKVKTVIGFAAMPQPIDHTQDPSVWFTATDKKLLEQLKTFHISPLIEGQISGMNGLFLGYAQQSGLEGLCLLGDIPLYTIQIENPRASAKILEVLGKILNISIDASLLLEQAQNMDEEINKLLEFLKVGPTAGPIGEEEIEKIKKSLSQLTKLPISVKEKIEKLFVEAEKDLSQAKVLKVELDKWNVYKEYEDRFLDLFRKNRDKGN